jgi:hypothetical protein
LKQTHNDARTDRRLRRLAQSLVERGAHPWRQFTAMNAHFFIEIGACSIDNKYLKFIKKVDESGDSD